MHVFILSTIQWFWLVLPHTLPTPWMNGNSEMKMACNKHAAGLLINFLSLKSLSQQVKSVPNSLTFRAIFCWVMIPNYQIHDSHTRSLIAVTITLPNINVSMINPNIVNSQYSCSCMNMNNVMIKYTKHQKETQNVNKKLQIITHPSTLQSARQIPTHNANHCTTV
jgi:hypothetical protein